MEVSLSREGAAIKKKKYKVTLTDEECGRLKQMIALPAPLQCCFRAA
jgi:hypothetical protein